MKLLPHSVSWNPFFILCSWKY